MFLSLAKALLVGCIELNKWTETNYLPFSGDESAEIFCPSAVVAILYNASMKNCSREGTCWQKLQSSLAWASYVANPHAKGGTYKFGCVII